MTARNAPVLHLFGSPTSEFWFELSMTYASGTHDALNHQNNFLNAMILPDGSWRVGRDCAPTALRETAPLSLPQAVSRILGAAPGCCLPQMFCHRGMTDYRGFVEALGIPLIGNRAQIMALAADKALTRAIMADAEVKVPKAVLLRKAETETHALVDMPAPFVVKPVVADNSAGISLVTHAAELPAALRQAFAECDRVLIEDFIPLGREVRAGIVEIEGRAVPLPLEEYNVDPVARPIRTAADKLASAADGGIALMAKTQQAAWIVAESDPVTQPVQHAALECHKALGARDYSLFDFRIDPAGQPWFLEAGPYCSFSPDSVLVAMMQAAGTPLPRFFEQQRDRAAARRPHTTMPHALERIN